MAKIRVELNSSTSASASRPLLLDTLPGDLPENLALQIFQSDNPRKSTKQVMLKGETERVRFEATNFGQVPSIAASYSYALCYTDDDGHLRVVAPCERLHGKRVVKSLEGIIDKKRAPEPEQLDYRTAQNALGEAFGTKKRRQAIHSIEKNQINMDRLKESSAAFINKTIDDTIVSRLPTPEPSEAGAEICSNNGILPPFCILAEKAADCYPVIGSLVPKDIWMALPQFDDESSFSLALSPCSYIKSRLSGLFSPGSIGQYIAAYLHYLVKLFPLKEAQYNDNRTTSSLLFGIEAAVQARILEEFSEPVSTDAGKRRFKLPAVKKDRLALHICVLALHLDSNMRVSINELADELSLSVNKVQQYFRALGCHIDTQGKKSGEEGKLKTLIRFARLQTPLVFPKPSLKR